MNEKIDSEDMYVKIEFEVAPFATDFLEAYLKFIGSSQTVEDVAREAFFEEICTLRDKLMNLPHQQDDDFFKKYPYVGLLESRENQKRLAELERQKTAGRE